MSKPIIYVAGPYTRGDVAWNVHNAIKAADDLANLGYTPFIPHLSHFWHLVSPKPYQFWCDYDLEFLPFCSAVLRLEGESAGADNEERVAQSLGIPIFRSLSELAANIK